MDEQRPDHDGRDRIARNAQRHHRDESPTDSGVVRGFGRHQALARAFSEWHFRVRRHALGVVIGHQRRDVATGSRQGADDDADGAALQRQRQVFHDRAPGRHDAADLLLDGSFVDIVQLHQRFGDAEHPDHHRNERNAAAQFGHLEGEPIRHGQRIEADRADENAKRSGEHALDQTVTGQ